MKEVVYNNIGIGFGNKVSKSELKVLTGYPDRVIRNHIAELRNEGEMIVSTSKFNGYYIATNHDVLDVEIMRAETISRIRHLKNIVDCCDKWLESINQEVL